ncbi:MAG TPA: hypothetical protein VEK77_09575 [Gemmatimonadales bacterium]|nr:hypothetical protein [Gemmatimonadales bacterium]
MQQEAPEVRDGAAPTALGDIRDHRHGRSNQLIGSGECARAAERLGQLGALLGHSCSNMGDEQSAGIGAENHAPTIAFEVRRGVIIPTRSVIVFPPTPFFDVSV